MKHSKISRFVMKLLVLLIFCTPQTLSASPLPWYKLQIDKFTSYEFKISVIFPSEFEEEIKEKTADNGDITRTLKLKCKKGENTYMLNVTKHPFNMTDAKGLAETSLEAFARGVKGDIRKQEIFTQKGHEGIDAKLYLSEQNKYVYYRIILVGRLQYQMVIMENNSTLSGNANDFLISFKLQD